MSQISIALKTLGKKEGPEPNVLIRFYRTLSRIPKYRLLILVVRIQEQKRLQKAVDELLNVTTTASFVTLGIVNPLLGAISFLGMRLLENNGTKQNVSNYIAQTWSSWDPNLRVRLKIVTTITGAVGIIMIASLFVPKSELKGGFSGFAAKPVRLAAYGVEALVSEKFCPFIFSYATANGWTRVPNLSYVNKKLLLDTILLINKKIMAGEPINLINETSVLFNVDTAKGGLNFDAFRKPGFGNTTGGFFGNGIGLAPDTCRIILKYGSKYQWPKNFVPSGPQDVNYGLMSLALQYISYQIRNGKADDIYLSPEVITHLQALCTYTIF